jgi:hypothetical protein
VLYTQIITVKTCLAELHFACRISIGLCIDISNILCISKGSFHPRTRMGNTSVPCISPSSVSVVFSIDFGGGGEGSPHERI